MNRTFLLNFKPQFAPLVESGKKRQTIRRERKGCHQIGIGSHLKLYTGLRTRQCRLLGAGVVNYVIGIRIAPEGAELFTANRFMPAPDSLHKDDGFSSYQEMYEWFYRQYKTEIFIGRLIRWEPTQ